MVPQTAILVEPQAGSVPAGYEVRWWALDREGNEDDVAADVLEFATERRAGEALARAASTRCRRDGTAYAAHFPSVPATSIGSIPTMPSSGTCSSPVVAACTAS